MAARTPAARDRPRLRRLSRALTGPEWRTVAGMCAVVIGLHVVGFLILIALVAPHRYQLGVAGGFSIGLGLTAYTLGLRHALDADHISAIDNTTRKLMAERMRPLSVGFWFSLGHSSVVLALSFLFAIGVRALTGSVRHSGSTFHNVTNWIGTTVSGAFLYIIAAMNLVILMGIIKVFREMRGGKFDETQLEEKLNKRGLMNRVFGRFTRAVAEPWHMYPIGVLFGLGFDTASEVALLFLAAGAAGAGLPFYAVLCLPILFAAGMSLVDTIDGSFMNFAYGWSFSKPVRKIYYNITITGLSVMIALVIGTVELAGLVAHELDAQGSFWRSVENININELGVVVATMFVVTWAVALVIWRFGRVEERWTCQPTSAINRGIRSQPLLVGDVVERAFVPGLGAAPPPSPPAAEMITGSNPVADTR
jgi:high-affinity nickel-transport protein